MLEKSFVVKNEKGKKVQHSVFDTGCALEIHRWDETDHKARIVACFEYENRKERTEARSLAIKTAARLRREITQA